MAVSEMLNVVIEEHVDLQFKELEMLVFAEHAKRSSHRFGNTQKVFKNYLLDTDPYEIGLL